MTLNEQVDELKTTPATVDETAPALAAKSLDRDLNTTSSNDTGGSATVVNDLTSMVVKKKKKGPGATTASGKRKAEDEVLASETEKKIKVDDTLS